jgi:uncharacterized protein YciI
MARFIALVFISLLCSIQAANAQSSKQDRQQFYVIEFNKGPAWVDGVRYEKQPQIEAHLAYWKVLYYREVLLMSGPWKDESGGLFIVRLGDREMAQAVVDQDPAVSSGLIEANIQQWRVLSSAMRSVKPIQIEVKSDESFKVERIDPSSPLNLREDR